MSILCTVLGSATPVQQCVHGSYVTTMNAPVQVLHIYSYMPHAAAAFPFGMLQHPHMSRLALKQTSIATGELLYK